MFDINTLKIVGAVVGSVMTICGAIYASWPTVIGDYPPIANQDRVEKAIMKVINRIEQGDRDQRSATVKGDIYAAFRSCRSALRDGKISDADEFALQIANLQFEYRQLNNGSELYIPNCP